MWDYWVKPRSTPITGLNTTKTNHTYMCISPSYVCGYHYMRFISNVLHAPIPTCASHNGMCDQCAQHALLCKVMIKSMHVQTVRKFVGIRTEKASSLNQYSYGGNTEGHARRGAQFGDGTPPSKGRGHPPNCKS